LTKISNEPVKQMNTQHFRAIAQNAPPSAPEHTTASEGAKEMVKEEAIEQGIFTVAPGILSDMATAASDQSAGGYDNYLSGVHSNSVQQVQFTSFHSTGNVGSVPFSATVGAGVGVGADLFISFWRERYDRYKIRGRVLGKQDAIEAMFDESHQAAHDEMEKFAKLKKEDLGRIAEKIIWYGKKIHDLENDTIFKNMCAHIGIDSTFKESRFEKCDDAYNLWFSIQYVMRQYGKLIANLVCLEILLLQLDNKLVHMDIGVFKGSMVAEGTPPWPRPSHMKDIND
jgi:hypothetical protein